VGNDVLKLLLVNCSAKCGFLGCTEDWISAKTGYIISEKENDVGVWCDVHVTSQQAMPITHHSHAHKLLTHSCPQGMPTELLIYRSDCSS